MNERIEQPGQTQSSMTVEPENVSLRTQYQSRLAILDNHSNIGGKERSSIDVSDAIVMLTVADVMLR